MLALFRDKVIIFIIIYIALFYSSLFLLQDRQSIYFLEGSLFSITTSAICFFWLFHTYRVTIEKIKYFWLLLSFSFISNFIAAAIFFYYIQILKTIPPYPSFVDIFGLLHYFLIFLALVIKIRILSSTYSVYSFLFNIIILMTVIASISLGFFIEPIKNFSMGSISLFFISLALPSLVLLILFVTISLYMISQHTLNKTFLSIMTAGLFMLIFADYLFAFLMVYAMDHNSTWLINLIFPIYSLAWLIIGYASIYYRRERSTFQESIKPFKQYNGNNVTYFSIVLLLLINFVYESKIIEIGLIVTMLLVIIRQMVLLSENKKLTNHLEKRVEQRTNELNEALIKMENIAKYDNLTKLPNRHTIYEYLEESMNRCDKNTKKLAVMFIDLDRFKTVNDTLGHEAGDLLLIEASKRLKQSLRKGDIIGRQGGDEFIILLEDIEIDDLIQVAQRLLERFIPAFQLQGREFFTSPSIGISLYPDDALQKEDLIKNADIAMYLAKDRGKNNFQFYSSASNSIKRKLLIENGLRTAILNNELYLMFQPQVVLKTNQIYGMEALLRWDHPDLGKVNPDEFIPIAEKTGLIIPIGKWVLQTACEQVKHWQDNGYFLEKLAINISPIQFSDPNFIHDVTTVINKTELPSNFLELEITESLMQNINESKYMINQLKELGISISIDDFGTGYSSLSILNQLHINKVKIDRGFINEMLTNSNTSSLVKTIIDMGYNLNIELVAEGIELEEQAIALKNLNCQLGQGYFFNPPLREEEAKKLLQKKSY